MDWFWHSWPVWGFIGLIYGALAVSYWREFWPTIKKWLVHGHG